MDEIRGRGIRALIIAESANPEWESVPLEGWSHSAALADIIDAHVVTKSVNTPAFCRAGRVEGRDFDALDIRRSENALRRLADLARGDGEKGWTLVTAAFLIPYYDFEWQLWRRFGRRIASGEFDLVHRLTPLTPSLPSLVAKKCRRVGVPFILGPLAGGLPWPAEFADVRSKERDWLSCLRKLHRLAPGYRATRSCASAIIVGSQSNLDEIPMACREKCIYIPVNGIDVGRFGAARMRVPTLPLRCAFVGRLVPYKGADMVVEATAEYVRSGRLILTMIGDGPERGRLEQLIRSHGIVDGARLLGRIPHDQVQNYLAETDIFMFPSVREFGGAVVVEAMAMGAVPIVVDYGGPAEHVSPQTGRRVPLGCRAEIIAGLTAALAEFISEPGALRPLSERARRRARTLYDWKAKALQTREVYRWVLQERPEKPDFGLPLIDPP